MNGCKVPGCVNGRWARGFCGSHLYQWKKGKLDIEPDARRVALPYAGAVCSAPECTAAAAENGMCAKHAQRVRRYGDPSHLTPEDERRANNRAAQLARVDTVKPDTYRKLNGRHEHRTVAENKLGRPLEKGEVVHHEDEDRQNNDPRNLIVFRTQAEHALYHSIKNAARRLAALSNGSGAGRSRKAKNSSSGFAPKQYRKRQDTDGDLHGRECGK
jgi:hypothetical protein